MERHVVAERQGAKGERKKVRRIEEEDGGSLEDERERGPVDGERCLRWRVVE